MYININDDLIEFMNKNKISISYTQLPDIVLDTDKIRVIMINEVPPKDSDDYFYSKSENPDYMNTTLSLFQDAGIDVKSINEIIDKGIYITTAVKIPKEGYDVEKEKIISHLPILEYEISLFPNLKVVMLMGDVAKKAFNMIAKKNTKKNVIPSGSTYKIRNNKFFYGNLRIFPSYIMTGGNILIEKSKYHMVTEDIIKMMEYVSEQNKV